MTNNFIVFASSQDSIMDAKVQSSTLPENRAAWSLDTELLKNEKLRKEDVYGLREFCSNLSDVDTTTLTDNLMVGLLHSCDYDMEKARHTATKFFEHRFSLLEIFENRDIDSEAIQTALKVGSYVPLPKKTPDGYRIILQALRQKDASLYDHLSLSRIQGLTLDSCVHDDPTCRGYLFLSDMDGLSMSHMWNSDFSLTKKLIKYSQEGAALKIYQMHMINASSFTYYIVRLLKPFIRKSLYETFRFYTADQMEEVYKEIPKECLPKDYGGNLPELDILCDQHAEWLRNMKTKVEILPKKSNISLNYIS